MNKGLSASLKAIFPGIKAVVRPVITNTVIPSIFWLVGFVDGEGNFYIKINKAAQKVSLVFSISQHSRDKVLFSIIQNFLNCGLIEEKSTRPNEVYFCSIQVERYHW